MNGPFVRELGAFRRTAVAMVIVMGLAWLALQACGPAAVEPTATTAPPKATVSLGPTCATVGQTWTRPADGMEMVCVPAGSFLMGSASSDTAVSNWERPQHTVTLEGYWIDRTEVTVAHFRAFVQATGHRTTAEVEGSSFVHLEEAGWQTVSGAIWQHPQGPGRAAAVDDHPVVQVSWDDATAYCAWVGGALPTEAQWEKAARGTDGRVYPWGNEFDGHRLNYCDANCLHDWKDSAVDDGYRYTAPVGSYPEGASPYGALDMAGNVWEWTSSLLLPYPYRADDGREGPTSRTTRALRGGAWYDDTWAVRTTARSRSVPSDRLDRIGFRCAFPASGSWAEQPRPDPWSLDYSCSDIDFVTGPIKAFVRLSSIT